MMKTSRYAGESIYSVFCLIKLCFTLQLPALSEQWFLFLQTTEFKVTKENQSKRIC